MDSMQIRGAKTLLLLDTCGERASLAVARDGQVQAERVLTERTASGALLGAIREALEEVGMGIMELDGIGVVNGPGSFTGVRVGLAMAKGLCEATGVKMAGVSRLTVLAEASGAPESIAVLWAGQEQVYVREASGRELLVTAGDLTARYGKCAVGYAEDEVFPWLSGELIPRRMAMRAGLSLGLVQRCLAEGGSDSARIDANYVRNEEAIYARQPQRS